MRVHGHGEFNVRVRNVCVVVYVEQDPVELGNPFHFSVPPYVRSRRARVSRVRSPPPRGTTSTPDITSEPPLRHSSTIKKFVLDSSSRSFPIQPTPLAPSEPPSYREPGSSSSLVPLHRVVSSVMPRVKGLATILLDHFDWLLFDSYRCASEVSD